MTATRPRVDAVTLKVEDVLLRLRDGSIRIPIFQRPLKWKREDNRLFFDSLLGGYPVGSLLMWKRVEEAARVKLGPFETEAPGNPQAWRVVDGQQRLTALAGALLPVPDRPPEFDFGVDLATEKVVPRARKHGPGFLPLDVLGNVESLVPYLHANPSVDVQQASSLSKRLREYPLSVVLLDADDETFVESVFTRLNSAGRPLTKVEVFRAAHARKHTGTVLADAMALGAQFRFGDLDESNLLRALKALAGQDPLSDMKEAKAGGDGLIRGTREAIVLLKKAGIPTAELLPYSLPFGVLVAFFARHPEVSTRTRQLLEFWFWRATLSFKMQGDFSSIRDLYGRAVIEDEHEAAQALLKAVPVYVQATRLQDQPTPTLKSALGQIIALIMIDATPRNLVTGEPLSASALLEVRKPSALFQAITPVKGAGVVNTIFHPKLSGRHWQAALEMASEETLRSHLLPLPIEDSDDWFQARSALLADSFIKFAEKKTGVGQSTRPALSALGEPES